LWKLGWRAGSVQEPLDATDRGIEYDEQRTGPRIRHGKPHAAHALYLVLRGECALRRMSQARYG
jgi:hypothetical protein